MAQAIGRTALMSIVPDRRLMRANQLTNHIMHIVSKYVDRDKERDCMRDLSHALVEALHQNGAEIVTDEDRRIAGLPPRGPEGWTDEELQALEQKRLEVMLRPILQMKVAAE